MKASLLILGFAITLTSIVGCKSEKKSEDCSINGVKVSCDEFKKREEDRREIGKVQSVAVIIKSNYIIENGKIKFEKEFTGFVNHQEGDTTYSCGVENKIREYDITVNQRELQLVNGADSVFFSRLEIEPVNTSNLLIGTFKETDNAENHETTLKFSAKEVEFKHICLFK